MPTPHITPHALLMDRVLRDELGEGVIDVVIRLADAGKTYREIGLFLHDASGLRVSHETVRGWEKEWRHQRAGAAA